MVMKVRTIEMIALRVQALTCVSMFVCACVRYVATILCATRAEKSKAGQVAVEVVIMVNTIHTYMFVVITCHTKFTPPPPPPLKLGLS